MDDRRFDQFARALGGASTRRSALAALAGLLAGGAALTADTDAKRRKRRKRCEPACAAGQTCVQGTCACADGGTACGDACCAPGQRCRDGACADPLPACIAPGEPCKDTGRRCCGGRACASGQGGKTDIACHVPAGGACETTDDCVFAAECVDGACIDRQQIGPDWPDIPDESCEPNVAAGDTAGLLRALREEGEARLAPGEYVFELGEGETAIDLPETGGRIIGCRGSASLEGRQRRDPDWLQDWSVVCRGKAGVSEWTCVRISNPATQGAAPQPYFVMLRVQVIGRGTSGSTWSVGIVDERRELHGVFLFDVAISCFNRGLVQAAFALVDYQSQNVAFCRNLDGTCFVRSGSTLTPLPLVGSCRTPVETCSCGQSGPCSPNVIALDTAELLATDDLRAKLAAGEAILPPNSTYAFTVSASRQAAMTIPNGISTKLRSCPGTDPASVVISCTDGNDPQVTGWKCIDVAGGGVLSVDGVTISGAAGNMDVSSTGIYAGWANGSPGSVTLSDTRITGFGTGIYKSGGNVTCPAAGNTICGNNANCQTGGQGNTPSICSPGCYTGGNAC